MNVASVILAAGQGTRMRSKLPKVLHPLGGQPMILYAVNLAMQFTNQPPVVVVGLGASLVQSQVGVCARYVLQEQRLGTGHAVLQARDELQGRADAVLVLYGDMPLLTPPTISNLMDVFATHAPAVAIVTLEVAPGGDTMGFGRIVRDAQGRVVAIVEEAAATAEERAIRELNCGVYCFRGDWLWDHLVRLQVGSKGEYLLTDLIAMAASEGESVLTVPPDQPSDVLGINDRLHLARAEMVLRRRINDELMRGGVTLIDPRSTYVETGVKVAPDTVIYPNTYLLGDTSVGDDCILGPNTLLRNTTVGPRCRIVASTLEDSAVGADVTIGPYSHLRGGARIDSGVHIGNFGEVKNSYLGSGAKMGHFSYIGDATVGMGANIGAGTVTCNFDGRRKHATLIGDRAFIGSGSMLVAPVEIGAGAKVGAGAVVTHDVPANTVAFGVPARVRHDRHPEEVHVQPEDAVSEEQRAAEEPAE
ncbi:MAG: bifunctional UDP-N-acetylglucosamine diphosphorylase/glucosamine-1-phosphate N-acetyltransferase GlmU [Anaerolineae bacterium]